MSANTQWSMVGSAVEWSRKKAHTARGRRTQQAQQVHPAEEGAMLYWPTLATPEPGLQFCSFDAAYIENLRAEDIATQDHFVRYFTALLQLKLRSRLRSPQAIEDVRQETFVRVLKALRTEGALRQPDRLGAFVNTVCNNVLFEHSLDEEGQPELPAKGASAYEEASAKQITVKVREVLLGLPVRDRMLLKAVFLDERDRDEVCKEFGVDREYLRVLLYRAKKDFKVEFLKRVGDYSPVDPRI